MRRMKILDRICVGNVFSAMSEILRSTTDKATMFHPFYLCMHVTFWHSYQIQYKFSTLGHEEELWLHKRVSIKFSNLGNSKSFSVSAVKLYDDINVWPRTKVTRLNSRKKIVLTRDRSTVHPNIVIPPGFDCKYITAYSKEINKDEIRHSCIHVMLTASVQVFHVI
jgi:hypothetical protein